MSNAGEVYLLYFYLLIVLWVVFDQAAKIAIRANLALGEQAELWGFLPLIHLENQGTSGTTAFHGYGWLFAVIALILVAAGLYLRGKGKFRTPLAQAGLALAIGGAIGNAIDRLAYNQVTDFLHFADRTTMNIADIGVYVGVLLIAAHWIASPSAQRNRSEDR